jgi:hypothetical protein
LLSHPFDIIERMFDHVAVGNVGVAERTAAVQRARLRPQSASVGELRELAGRVAPVSLAADLLLPVGTRRLPGLADLLPGRGLRRGSVVGVDGPAGAGVVSLALALVAAASAAGSWVGFVGFGARWGAPIGWVAAAEVGLDLDRVAVVADPGREWPVVAGALLDALDVVVIRPPPRRSGGSVRLADARRLTARARERAAVLVVVGDGWPEGPDARLTATGSRWSGLGAGHGVLTARTIDVVATGRGAAARRRHAELPWVRAA